MPIESLPPLRDCYYLTGPTASGKTLVGLTLAERLDAEIVSMDSMAIYRRMNIGTAKPTGEQTARVPHHLIDIVEPIDEFSVPQFVAAAHRTVAEIRGRGKKVLFVGGTPLYLKALLRGVYPGPPADWKFRRQIDEELELVSIDALHERLRQVDPLSASRLHPNDKRRIVRALEVYRATGKPISHEQFHFDEVPSEPVAVSVLQWERSELHRRIAARVERMFEVGLVDEVRHLIRDYEQLGRTASQAVGYSEVLEYLEGGTSLAEAIERVMRRTRQFARRQETWFRSLEECRSLQMKPDFESETIVEQILGTA
jgi:tRNA dimethylallyltransferase